MSEGTRHLFVGVFVLAAIVVLCVLMVWFGETPTWLRQSDWELRITGVEDLAGINAAAPVTLNGVQIGRVDRIEFVDPKRPDRGVVLIARIQNQFSVPRSAVARVYGATLGFGMGHVDLVMRPNLPMDPLDRINARIPGEMRSLVGELISKETLQDIERTIHEVGELAEAAKPVARNLALLLEERPVSEVGPPETPDRPLMPNLSTVVERLEAVLAHADSILGDPNVQSDLKAAVNDLRAATAELRKTIETWGTESQRLSDNLNQGIDRTENHLEESFRKLNLGLENLDSATRSIANVVRRTEEGQGTLGLLARDERLYESAVLTLSRLGELAATLQRIAGKIEEDGYITVGQTTPVGTFTRKFPVGGSAEPRE